MKIIRKTKGCIVNALLICMVGCVIYFMYLLTSHIFDDNSTTIHLISDKDSSRKLPNNFIKPSDQHVLSSFEQRDMLDEHGNPFSIVIQIGTPVDYKANPHECMDNINCEIRSDLSASPSAHAVVFKASSIPRSLPLQRYPHQLYVWWTSESPFYSHKPPELMDHSFNLSFHYRTDADVYAPYGSINLLLRELRETGEDNLQDLLLKKGKSNKLAAWATSNCYPERMKFAKSLIDHGLKVDTFGTCFFPQHDLGDGTPESVLEELSEYKFYFSFENSISCKDYITEKFWYQGLRSGAVPIVWGPKKEDVLKVAPTKSFIHSDDFSSPAALVKYLLYLDSNATAYSEYLQWRTWVNHPERIEERLQRKNKDNDLRSFCKLCSILQTDAKRRRLGLPQIIRQHSSMMKHWVEPDKECHV